MAPRITIFIALTTSTILISLMCIALYFYHAQPRCSTQSGDYSISECMLGTSDLCDNSPGYSFSDSQSINGVNVKWKITCPFQRTATYLGVIGFIATFLLLRSFYDAVRGRKGLGAFILALGVLIIALLSFSFGLMISDVLDGANYYSKTEKKMVFCRGSYIINILLTFIGIILIGLVTFFGFEAEKCFGESESSANQQQHQGNELAGLVEMTGEVIVGGVEALQRRNGYAVLDEE